jgi:ankyrin repeat protein
MLVEFGLDVNATDHDGRTPLMGAALKGLERFRFASG